MPEARICLDEILPHPCPLGTLAAKYHRNDRRDSGSLGKARCFELAILPNGECSLAKPFSVDGEGIREVGNGVRVVMGVGLVQINLVPEGWLGIR
jgi:hypothetical protein